MTNVPAKLEKVVRRGLRYVQGQVRPTEIQKTRKEWAADGGYHRHRFDYELNQDSVVFDLGGFRGQWAADLFARFGCDVLVFEPVSEYAEHIRDRFRHNPKVRVFEFGLGGSTRTDVFQVQGAASSKFITEGSSQSIEIVAFEDFMVEQQLSKVDVLKMNIEGGEYELLTKILDTGNIEKFVNIQIQFHDLYPTAEAEMLEIQRQLSNTHELTFHYKFLMENWARRA